MLVFSLGIDISKATLDVALFNGNDYKFAKFDNTKDGFRRLCGWLKKNKARGCHACLEATGRYGEAVADYLHNRNYPVSVVNPARIKAYGQSQLKRNKTDREDAKVIAHFCATQKPDLWSPPLPHIRELQALARRLNNLKADRTREKNRLLSGLASKVVINDIKTHIAFLNCQIGDLHKRIHKLIDHFPDLRRQKELLKSIPGISDVSAAGFLAEVPDALQFESASQLATYAGLTPRQHQSGTSIHKRGRMSKMGNKHLRTLFFMPTLSARRCNPIIIRLVQRLEHAGKQPKTIRGAAMHKMLRLAYGVLKTGQPFDPNFVNVQNTC